MTDQGIPEHLRDDGGLAPEPPDDPSHDPQEDETGAGGEDPVGWGHSIAPPG